MPSITLDEPVEASQAALAPYLDERIRSLVRLHPTLGLFLKSFHGEFGGRIWPTVMIIRHDAPGSVRTIEALEASATRFV
jgi:hypothetical protein